MAASTFGPVSLQSAGIQACLLGKALTVDAARFLLVFGALGSQYFTDRFGRRRTFIVAALGFIVGVLIQTFAPSFTVLMLGRVFVGLGVGIGLAVSAHSQFP